MTPARLPLRLIDGGLAAKGNPVKRLHAFQADHPDVRILAPHMGGRGQYIAVIPPETIPGDPCEIIAESLDLTGLMDNLDELFLKP